jgi:hypothetical protein
VIYVRLGGGGGGLHSLLLDLFNKFGDRCVEVGDETRVSHLEDRCLRVLQEPVNGRLKHSNGYDNERTLLIATMSLESFIPAKC